MGPEDYIFIPHSDSALRLKRADGSPIVGQWDRNRPISQQEANRCLRQYAKRAGLEADRLHIHALRHTASQLYKIGGTPLEERSRMLHHKSFETTRIYDHKVSGQLKVGWQNVASLLGL
jgi:site-specific recombinase XerD